MKKGLTQVGDFQVGKFVLVKIHPAASKMDRKIPQLPANGRTAIVKRGEIVPLSLAHFSSLESAKVPYYSEQGGGTPDNPTKGRKLLGYRQRFPFDLLHPDVPEGAYREIRPLTEGGESAGWGASRFMEIIERHQLEAAEGQGSKKKG